MRNWVGVTAFAVALAGGTAYAADLTRQQAVAQAASADPAKRSEAIHRLADVGTLSDVAPLYRGLRDEDEDVRREAEHALWAVWSRSGDPAVDALYETGIAQMQRGELDDAIETFSRIIRKRPGFAEGWNKRATVYFLTGDLRKSLADCDEVVKRNPRHFGVLAGYAQIYASLGYFDRALEYSRKALAVNPNLDGVRRNVELLEQLVEQKRKQMI
jgi:tetratricopeptide (TPR) repeat protein